MTPALFFFLLCIMAVSYGIWCLWPAARMDRLRLGIGRHRAGALNVRRWRDHSRQ